MARLSPRPKPKLERERERSLWPKKNRYDEALRRSLIGWSCLALAEIAACATLGTVDALRSDTGAVGSLSAHAANARTTAADHMSRCIASLVA